mmetsp:Transcript_44420/g.128551  ORF Transcript_44420/g.128551 Transcript_44420/m.128551 type:complete len:543 (-) Transcript_44420:762-2390(-)
MLQEAEIAHGRSQAPRVCEDLCVLRHLGIEERVRLVELGGLLQHGHLLDEVLQGKLLRALRAEACLRPDAHGLGEVPRADVADQRGPGVELLVLQPVRQLLAEDLVLVAGVRRDDGQRLLPAREVRRGHQLLEVVGHDVAHGRQEGVRLQPQELVPGTRPKGGPSARGQQQCLSHAPALEATLHGRWQIAHEDRLLDDGLGARRPVREGLGRAAGRGRSGAQGLLHEPLLLALLVLPLLLLGVRGQLIEETLCLREVQLGPQARRRLGHRLLALLLLGRRAHERRARLLAEEALGVLQDAVLVEAQENWHARAPSVLELRAHELPHEGLVRVAASARLLLAVVAELALANPGLEEVRAGHHLRLVGHHEGVAEGGDGRLRRVGGEGRRSLPHAEGHHLAAEAEGHSAWLPVPARAVLGAGILLLLHGVDAHGAAVGSGRDDGGLVRRPLDLEVVLLRGHLAKGVHLALAVAPAYQPVVLSAGHDEVRVLRVPGDAKDALGVASGLLEGIRAVPEVPHLDGGLPVVVVCDDQLRGHLRVPLHA